MPICLATAAKSVVVAADIVTLVWTHSVERTEWRETYVVDRSMPGLPPMLALTEARIKGSGAGMEPGTDAKFVKEADGSTWWVWRPKLPGMPDIRLARSGAVTDWRLCTMAGCRTAVEILGGPASADAVLKVCEGAPGTGGGLPGSVPGTGSSGPAGVPVPGAPTPAK